MWVRSYEKVTINVPEPWMKDNNRKSLYVESIDQENKTKYSIGILIITKAKKIKQNIALAFSSFIHFTPAFFSGESLRQKPLDPKLLMVSSNLQHLWWIHIKTGPSKVGDVITPPGRWLTVCSLSRGCIQQDSSRQSLIRHSGHVAEPLCWDPAIGRSSSTFRVSQIS